MAYDPEEYNVREIMKAEEQRERAGEDMEPDVSQDVGRCGRYGGR